MDDAKIKAINTQAEKLEQRRRAREALQRLALAKALRALSASPLAVPNVQTGPTGSRRIISLEASRLLDGDDLDMF